MQLKPTSFSKTITEIFKKSIFFVERQVREYCFKRQSYEMLIGTERTERLCALTNSHVKPL